MYQNVFGCQTSALRIKWPSVGRETGDWREVYDVHSKFVCLSQRIDIIIDKLPWIGDRYRQTEGKQKINVDELKYI